MSDTAQPEEDASAVNETLARVSRVMAVTNLVAWVIAPLALVAIILALIFL